MLEVPYSDPRELTMEVLRHGASVEVLAPRELREAIATELAAALVAYAGAAPIRSGEPDAPSSRRTEPAR